MNDKTVHTEKDESHNFSIRFATEADVSVILGFIKELATYENLMDQVVATEEKLIESLFRRKAAEVVIGEYNHEPVGFALFFNNYSTFLGQAGIYLEDLYVKSEMRGKGFGQNFLSYLGKLAVKRGCGRLEWSCLDWNESSINFYKKLGAKAMDEWTVYRVSDEALHHLANGCIYE